MAIFVAQISAGEGQDWTVFCGGWRIDIFDCVCGWVTAESLRGLDPWKVEVKCGLLVIIAEIVKNFW